MRMTGPDLPMRSRFPMPPEWILKQIPEELHKVFGWRGEDSLDWHADQIHFVYSVTYPDGSAVQVPLLAECVTQDDPAVTFIIDGLITLDDVPVTVESCWKREIPSIGWDPGYTYWEVQVRMPAEAPPWLT
jgi:hypothetical protein